MRKEQNIFVEFSNFPEKVKALLDFCIANSQEEDPTRFLCVMRDNDESESTLVDIFEHNEFRNLLHLRLDFKRATPVEAS